MLFINGLIILIQPKNIFYHVMKIYLKEYKYYLGHQRI